jgi:hypothetical protein
MPDRIGTAVPTGPNEAEPLIISASRATDIPAFHMPWFMDRLRAGFCLRVNPFNRRQVMRLSFARCKVIVFWSKDPRPLLPHVPEILERGFAFYLHYTLNDYEAEGLEPHLPPLAVRLETLARTGEAYGRERVIWRADPLLVGAALSAPILLERLDRLGQRISPYAATLMFSFLDLYAKIRGRLRTLDPGLRPPDDAERNMLIAGLTAANAAWPQPLRLAACAEKPAGTDSEVWEGIQPGACIDADLIRRLCPGDPDLAALAGKKDSGQRPDCACAPSRDVGAYNTCPHACVYCYANRSEKIVAATLRRRQPHSATLA